MTAALANLSPGLKFRRFLGHAGLLPFAGCLAVIRLVDCYRPPLQDDDYRRLRLRLSILVSACPLTAAAIGPGVTS